MVSESHLMEWFPQKTAIRTQDCKDTMLIFLLLAMNWPFNFKKIRSSKM